MATIRKKGDMQWHVQVRRKGFPVVTKTFISRADAELWGQTIESEMGRGVFVDRTEAESTTLLTALARYEAEVTVRKDGSVQERKRIQQWNASPLASRSLASLRGADFAKWRDARLKVVSISTLRKDLAVISHLFTVARKEWGMAVQNPISDIQLPTEDNSRSRRFEAGEELRLLNCLAPVKGRSPWMVPLVQFAVETAGRQSELLALLWSDIDIDRSTARLRGAARLDGKSRMKNKSQYRDVPLSSAAKAILAGLPRSISGRVFPISAPVVMNAFKCACKRAEIADMVFHDLRHEGTSRLADRLAMHELMKVTGHSSTKMLGRYYHPKIEDLAKKLA